MARFVLLVKAGDRFPDADSSAERRKRFLEFLERCRVGVSRDEGTASEWLMGLEAEQAWPALDELVSRELSGIGLAGRYSLFPAEGQPLPDFEDR